MLLFVYQSLPSDYEIFEKYFGGHSKNAYSVNEVPSPPEYQRCSYLAQPKFMTSLFNNCGSYIGNTNLIGIMYCFLLLCVCTLFPHWIVFPLRAKIRTYSLLVLKMGLMALHCPSFYPERLS